MVAVKGLVKTGKTKQKKVGTITSGSVYSTKNIKVVRRNPDTLPYVTDTDREVGNILNCSPVVPALLRIRGLINESLSTEKQVEYIQKYIDSADQPIEVNPFKLRNMDKAVKRFLEAVRKNQFICVYTDYDVDGITSAALWTKFFNDIDYYNYFVFIPNRYDHGYGLKDAGINELLSNVDKIDLLITADCGISDLKTIKDLTDKGIDVIVTDHHEPKEELPTAIVVNPKQEDDESGLRYLCGCGVSYFFLKGITKRARRKNLKIDVDNYFDLVALATVADIVPMKGVNRQIVRQGLDIIRDENRGNIGIKTIYKLISGKPLSEVTELDLGFSVGPAINAVSRLSSPELSYDCLIIENEDVVNGIAQKLVYNNKLRKEIEREAVELSRQTLDSDDYFYDKKVIVLYGKKWKNGIVGLIALRLCDTYHRPVIVFGDQPDENGYIKGSIRSVEGINIVENLMEFSKFFPDVLEPEKFGGHEMAAGLSVKLEKFEEFAELFEEHIAAKYDDDIFVKQIKADLLVYGDDVSIETAEDLKLIGPYGFGNSKPVFVMKGIKLKEKKQMGANSIHKILTCQDRAGRYYNFKYFFIPPEKDQELIEGRFYNIAFEMDKEIYKDKEYLSLKVVHVF